METELKDLIGKKVIKIFLNQDYLRFETDQGIFTYANICIFFQKFKQWVLWWLNR